MTNVLIAKKNRVLHITLNRPAKRNALTLEMSNTIASAIEDAQHAADIGCISFTAAGAVFCAGMDLEEAGDVDEQELSKAHERLFSLGRESLKPIVMAVDGAALGGGLGLVAQGHYVFASEAAAFGLPEIRVGLWPFLVYRSLTAALGPRRVLALSLTGEYFHAAEALDWGLVQRISPALEVEDHAAAMARHLSKASPEAIRTGMQYVRDSIGKEWSGAGELAAQSRRSLMATADYQEGRQAFKERRPARWPSMPSEFYSGRTTDGR